MRPILYIHLFHFSAFIELYIYGLSIYDVRPLFCADVTDFLIFVAKRIYR